MPLRSLSLVVEYKKFAHQPIKLQFDNEINDFRPTNHHAQIDLLLKLRLYEITKWIFADDNTAYTAHPQNYAHVSRQLFFVRSN